MEPTISISRVQFKEEIKKLLESKDISYINAVSILSKQYGDFMHTK